MSQDPKQAFRKQGETAAAFARWMIDAGEALARLQLETLRSSLEEEAHNVRAALEANAPEKLVRMRGEMLAAEARRMLEFARRYSELLLAQREQLAALGAKLGEQFDESMRAALAQFGVPGPEALPEPYRRMLDAARTVQDSMAALARQSSGMWEAHLRASQQAIERALALTGRGSPPQG
jgi:phasin family protein